MPTDPVCGMHVDEEKAAAKTEHHGKTYYFCSLGCKKTFEENPGKFIASQQEDEENR